MECGGIPISGESCASHATIASILEPTDAVISFNWDLIMDMALAGTGRWNEWAGYAPLTFDRILDLAGHWLTTAPSRPDFPRSSKLVYLKLHGSLNWFRSIDPKHPQRWVISLFESQIASGQLLMSPKDFEGQTCAQLIVPPTLHKDYTFFRPLWEKAEEALASAKELIIIGFSFTPADIQAQWLLHRGLARNPNAVSVILADRDRLTRDRISMLIRSINPRSQLVRQYQDFEKYILGEHGSIAITTEDG
jgi:hypothetical protein